MSAPDSEVVLFISVQSWMVHYLSDCQLHAITSHYTPTTMGASSEEPCDTITYALDFDNKLLNQTIKNLQQN
jgi:hypothetical protein